MSQFWAYVRREEGMASWIWLLVLLLPIWLFWTFVQQAEGAITSVHDQVQLAVNAAALAAANDKIQSVTYDDQGIGTIDYSVDQVNGMIDGPKALNDNLAHLNLGNDLKVVSTQYDFSDPHQVTVVAQVDFHPKGLAEALGEIQTFGQDTTIHMTVRGIARIHANVSGGS